MMYDEELIQEELREKTKELFQNEVVKWKYFLHTAPPSKAKELLEGALILFEKGEYYQSDDFLYDNYKIIARHPEVEQFIETTFTPMFHPLMDLFQTQLLISKQKKPQVGDLIHRYMSVVGERDGTYKVIPAKISHDKMMRVRFDIYNNDWIAVEMSNQGLIVFCDNTRRPDWSHLEITGVSSRACKAICKSIDFGDRVKKAALDFHRSLDRRGKVSITIEW